MPKNDIEKESLIALVLRYERCYEDIKELVDVSNDGPDSAMFLLGEVLERLDATFGSRGERTE